MGGDLQNFLLWHLPSSSFTPLCCNIWTHLNWERKRWTKNKRGTKLWLTRRERGGRPASHSLLPAAREVSNLPHKYPIVGAELQFPHQLLRFQQLQVPNADGSLQLGHLDREALNLLLVQAMLVGEGLQRDRAALHLAVQDAHDVLQSRHLIPREWETRACLGQREWSINQSINQSCFIW